MCDYQTAISRAKQQPNCTLKDISAAVVEAARTQKHALPTIVPCHVGYQVFTADQKVIPFSVMDTQ